MADYDAVVIGAGNGGLTAALTLARPEGAPEGGKGLALFYLEVRDAEGRMNGVAIHRLKDKLGTRKLPTAEIELTGTLAEPVAGLSDGVGTSPRCSTSPGPGTRWWRRP